MSEEDARKSSIHLLKQEAIKEKKDLSDEEVSDEEIEDEESDLENDSNLDNMEKLNFDFEAFSPCESDLEGLVNLITQVIYVCV